MLKRLQGKNWHKVKDNYELLYVYTSDRGNIKGIYQEIDGKKRVGHWMNNEEKEEYLRYCYKPMLERILTDTLVLGMSEEKVKR